MKTPLLLPVLCASLFGCATQATRENLRNCQWEVASVKMDTHTPQSYQGSATVRIRNVSKKTAILDSLWIDVATPGGPLAHLSHGRTLEVAAGGSDSAVIHFQAVPEAKQVGYARAMNIHIQYAHAKAFFRQGGDGPAHGMAIDGEIRRQFVLGRQLVPGRNLAGDDVAFQGFGDLAPQRGAGAARQFWDRHGSFTF